MSNKHDRKIEKYNNREKDELDKRINEIKKSIALKKKRTGIIFW